VDSPALAIILSVVFLLLLAYGHRGLRDDLRDGLGDSAAFGAVCLSLATVTGCWMLLVLYAGPA